MAILSQPFRMHAITSQLYIFLQCINTKPPKHKNMQVTNTKENHVDFFDGTKRPFTLAATTIQQI